MSLRGVRFESDTQRIRAGLVVLLAGLVVLLAALSMTALRGTRPPGTPLTATEEVTPPPATDTLPARVAGALLVLGIVLAAVFLVAVYALFRISRRIAQPSSPKPVAPTPADDVWQMHKVPDSAPGEPPDAQEQP